MSYTILWHLVNFISAIFTGTFARTAETAYHTAFIIRQGIEGIIIVSVTISPTIISGKDAGNMIA